ncbi:MAG: hypothetical protein Q4A69_08935 [Moraxella sp.]|nr:hypothetical protein [Moraxella sp.]
MSCNKHVGVGNGLCLLDMMGMNCVLMCCDTWFGACLGMQTIGLLRSSELAKPRMANTKKALWSPLFCVSLDIFAF